MYAIFCQPRNKNRAVDPPCLDPLDYGRDGEPYPDELLRRGRVRLFETRDGALAALRHLGQGRSEFSKDYAFIILECTESFASAASEGEG